MEQKNEINVLKKQISKIRIQDNTQEGFKY